MNSTYFSVFLPIEWENLVSNGSVSPSIVKVSQTVMQAEASVSAVDPLENKTFTALTPSLSQIKKTVETQHEALKVLKEQVKLTKELVEKWDDFWHWFFQHPKYVLQTNKANFFLIFKLCAFKLNILEDSSLNNERVDLAKERLEVSSKWINTLVNFGISCLKIYFFHRLQEKQKQDFKKILDDQEQVKASVLPASERTYYLKKLEYIQKDFEELKKLIDQENLKAEQEIRKPKNLFRSFSFVMNISTYLISSSCKIALKIAKPLYDIQHASEKLSKLKLLRAKQQQALGRLKPLKLHQNAEEFSRSTPKRDLLENQIAISKKNQAAPFKFTLEQPFSFSLKKELDFLVAPFSLKLSVKPSLQETAHEISPILDEGKAQALLKKRKEKRTKNIEDYLESHLQACNKLSSGEEIQCYLLQNLDFNLDTLPCIPKDKSAWLTALKNQTFQSVLANKHLSNLEQEETKAILLQRGFYQALLSKHKREELALSLQEFEHKINIFFACFQLFLLPLGKLTTPVGFILSIFTEELSKIIKDIPFLSPLGFIYLIFPKKFNFQSFLFLITEYLSCKEYKPHEYSLEGYKLKLTEHQVIVWTYILELKYLLEKMFIWTLQIVELSLFLKRQTPEARTQRYKERTHCIEQDRLCWANHLSKIGNDLNELRKKDAAFLISPNFKKEKRNETIFDLLQEEMQQINFHHVPEIKSWLEEYVKIDFENFQTEELPNKMPKMEMKDHLSQLFLKNYQEFLQA